MDLLRATAVTRGWNGHEYESAQQVNPEEENSPAAPVGTRTSNLSITSLVLYQHAVSTPGFGVALTEPTRLTDVKNKLPMSHGLLFV